MTVKELADSLSNDIFSLYPAETQDYKELIRDCVTNILNALPKGWSKEKYAQEVKKALNMVKSGQPK